ncbi:hypothetical protein F4781DRAFT_436389 [Annulohypoxylon bovei var. microspora]|nr:hypothetical protein F4781DRAFT_436389 [Annulohypoxylon bovei var. microspora]
MASTSYNPHPLPAPPQQGQHYNESYQPPVPPHQTYLQQQRQQRQQQAPQSQVPESQKPERVRPKSRAFSFRSDKSQKSANNSHHKVDLHETSKEKEANRLHGKTDPTFALTESEPAMDAQSKGGIGQAPLRSFQHKDVFGNPITDPDRSNPTRSRLERPLDTIRAFEVAIDGGYNRNSILRSDSESVANWSRRGSYYGNNNQPRFPQESYYGGRSNSAFRPESMMMDTRQPAMNGPRESYYEGVDGGPPSRNNAAPRIRYSRMQSDPSANGRGVPDRNVYPMPNNHRSNETVASGSGSGSLGEPTGYQTDPTSSDNSSIDRRSPPKRQEPVNDYGISFGQATQTPSLGLGAAGGPPSVPRKEIGTLLRKPSKAAVSNGYSEQRPQVEKRKSWFKRFSKS